MEKVKSKKLKVKYNLQNLYKTNDLLIIIIIIIVE